MSSVTWTKACCATLMACLASSATLGQTPPAPPVPPPPIVVLPAPNGEPPLQQLVQFVPGEVRCGEMVVAPVALEAPFPIAIYAPKDAELLPARFTFRIDATGRPLGIIARSDAEPNVRGRVRYPRDDLAPALAASHFPPGHAMAGCSIAYGARAVPADAAPAWLAHRYFVSPHVARPNDRDIFRGMHAADTNCIEAGTPKLRTRVFPDFDQIPQAPGTWSYAMTTFDVDASGKPVNVRIASSDGNAALDRASLAAVSQSRFAPEARHGCTFPYYRLPADPLRPPTPPEKGALEAADAKCSAEPAWSFMPELTFPAGFLRRRIEGWAVIGYDVASWGETGNLKVLAAEPAEEFGAQALSIVQRARKPAGDTGLTGCVTMVRFVMPAQPES